MKKLLVTICALACLTAIFSCDDGETYADRKNKEKNAINAFLNENPYTRPITVINEEQFYAQDSTTDTLKNEFVLFNDDGVYMQIVKQGEGKTMAEMAKTQSADSTISKNILCRFLEYDIESATLNAANIYQSSIVDKMLVKYSHRSRSYNASFTDGIMKSRYNTVVVPKGWLKPLDYIRLSRDEAKKAKVRLIVPHSSGTGNASNYVLPMYYEITYQLGN